MSTSEPSFQHQRRQRLLVAAALAVLGIGAASYGIRSRLALAAEPQSASHAGATTPMTTPMTSKSEQMRGVNADADVGPGNCEPCLVGSP